MFCSRRCNVKVSVPKETKPGERRVALVPDLTRKLVDALGGHVFAESRFGKGSTFTVVLPIRSVIRPDDPPRVVDEVPPPPPAER